MRSSHREGTWSRSEVMEGAAHCTASPGTPAWPACYSPEDLSRGWMAPPTGATPTKSKAHQDPCPPHQPHRCAHGTGWWGAQNKQAQPPLHTGPFPAHTGPCTHRTLYTQDPLHTGPSTHRTLHTQDPSLHTRPSTHRTLPYTLGTLLWGQSMSTCFSLVASCR